MAVTLDDLNGWEMIDVKKRLGTSIEAADAIDTAYALVWVLKRHENAEFTWENALDMTLKEIQEFMGDDDDVVSENLSKAADNFEVQRRVVMFNGITDQHLLTIEGACSIVDDGNQLEVTCKVGDDTYKKHFLGLSDNASYFVEQGEPIEASAYHYRVTFKPQQILPDVDFRGSSDDGPTEQE